MKKAGDAQALFACMGDPSTYSVHWLSSKEKSKMKLHAALQKPAVVGNEPMFRRSSRAWTILRYCLLTGPPHADYPMYDRGI